MTSSDLDRYAKLAQAARDRAAARQPEPPKRTFDEMVTTLATALDFATMSEGVVVAYVGPAPVQVETAKRMWAILKGWGLELCDVPPEPDAE